MRERLCFLPINKVLLTASSSERCFRVAGTRGVPAWAQHRQPSALHGGGGVCRCRGSNRYHRCWMSLTRHCSLSRLPLPAAGDAAQRRWQSSGCSRGRSEGPTAGQPAGRLALGGSAEERAVAVAWTADGLRSSSSTADSSAGVFADTCPEAAEAVPACHPSSASATEVAAVPLSGQWLRPIRASSSGLAAEASSSSGLGRHPGAASRSLGLAIAADPFAAEAAVG